MKTKKIGFNYRGKKVNVDARVCKGSSMGLGLMFRTKNTMPVLFELGSPVRLALTSLFCFFSFVVVWFKDDKIVDIKVVKPWRFIINSKNRFDKILEIPINKKYHRQIRILVGGQKV